MEERCISRIARKRLSREKKVKSLEIAFRVLVAIGKISNAKKLIPIKWAHVSGVSYLTIGDYGMDFLKKISSSRGYEISGIYDGEPCGMDIENWDLLNVPCRIRRKTD